MLKSYRLSVGASAFAMFVAPLSAQAEVENQQLSAIIVTAQTVIAEAEAGAAKRPGGVDIVAASAFEDKLAVSLRDALAFSPGVYTQPRFGQEVRLSIRGSGISRGFHMRGLTLLQDGIPINLADDNGDFQELDPQIFQWIEVYRGGNALRFGGSTLGGAINAVTPTGRTAPGFELRIDGGSFNTVRAKAAAAFATARGDAYLAMTTDHSDGDRQHAKRSAIRFHGNVGLRLTDRIETRFYAAVNHINQDLPGTLTRAQALRTPKLSLPNNIVNDQERDIDSIRVQSRTTVDLGTGRLAFGGYYNTKKLFHPIFQFIDQNSDDRGLFASVDVAGDAGGVSWELTLGTQARFGKVAAKQFVNVAGSRGALTANVRQTAHTINSYGEVRVTPVARLTLIGGGIHTRGERKADNRLVAARSGKARFDSFSPKVGILFEPIDKIQFYANYNRSVELPGFSELNQTPANGLPGFVNLRPQRAWTFEIGARGSSGMASWDVSFYRADIKGELLQFAISPFIPAATFNADKTRHQGIEAGFNLELARWIRLRQVYQYNDFTFRNDAQYGDNRLPVVPRHQYRAEVRFAADGFSVTPNIEWIPRGAYADYANSSRTPGYALFGLGAEARIREGIILFADVRNLAGKKAIGDISAVLRAVPTTVAFYPVERRAFYGGVRATF